MEPRLLGKYTQNYRFFPGQIRQGIAVFAGGDAEHEAAPSGATFEEALPALTSRSIVAELHGIPIGPVAFLDEQPDQDTWECNDFNPFKDDDDCELLRSEDSLQARSFDLALSTGDFSWAIMAPMTKAVVRGMDVIQEFLQQRYPGRQVVKEFVLTGHSKRGHIVWLAAALDDRVVGVAPVSYDLLNFGEQIALQDASWPARSQEQDPNMEFDLYTRYKTAIGLQLMADLDAYAYRDRLNIPGLILVGTGDPYSCSDAMNLYFDNMSKDTRILYTPNKGHDIRELPAVENATVNFYRHIINSRPLPEFTWAGLQEGSFTVTPGQKNPLPSNCGVPPIRLTGISGRQRIMKPGLQPTLKKKPMAHIRERCCRRNQAIEPFILNSCIKILKKELPIVLQRRLPYWGNK